ncbi:hypothetical protein BDE36_1282 [Arcticibacter tournemirensis]|uniref:Uncharacterized protein n=1 Tax=Arcticibacter tournemirensis TaxID=699437 RepID=A0A5M9GVM9_9SPHI|nr:hypothetical protein [Arcticibacter tournemirensis]KAA8476864.1 hypothetical protein F1649_19510 [Arcticibacter tournemirensis]TQM49565.1 hypothetical protein BDE36_1282 [Arcticibacter tournemirensis]
MKLKDLVHLLKNAAEQGASNALAESGQLQDQLTKAEAYRLYGRGNVDRWISEGLISPATPKGDHSRKCLDRNKLEAVAASSNRITYLPAAER